MISTTAKVTRLLVLTVYSLWRPILHQIRTALLEEPREQDQDQENQNYHYKYRNQPTPHFLTSLARDLFLMTNGKASTIRRIITRTTTVMVRPLFILPHLSPYSLCNPLAAIYTL